MIEEQIDFDNFFYFGEGDLGEEIASDLLSIIVQPKRSLFYSRSKNSAGIDEYENNPNTVLLRILLPYDIISAVAVRNSIVGNGQNGTKERRIATSQDQVKIFQNGNNLDASVFYIPYYNLGQKRQVGFQVGINSRG